MTCEWYAIIAVLLGYIAGFLMRGLWTERRLSGGTIQLDPAVWAEGERQRREIRNDIAKLQAFIQEWRDSRGESP